MNITPRVHNVVVTGGGSGIGFEITRKLISEGCNVCICGRNIDKLNRAYTQINSPQLSTIQFDVTEIEKIDKLIEDVEKKFNSKIEGLVNCAGIKTTSVCKPGLLETEIGYDAVMSTNLKSVVFLTRQFAQYFQNNNIHGNIVNISSAQGMANKMVTAYQMAKNNVIRFTRGIGKDFAKYGIVINGIAPGCTYSDMTPRPKSGAKPINKLHYNLRTLEPSEIADVCVFLMSCSAASIIGDTIMADGGFISAI